jgi:hypothetical protein
LDGDSRQTTGLEVNGGRQGKERQGQGPEAARREEQAGRAAEARQAAEAATVGARRFQSLNGHGPSGEDEIARRLFPDQETFKREERRRFELVDAHWDVPVMDVDLG